MYATWRLTIGQDKGQNFRIMRETRERGVNIILTDIAFCIVRCILFFSVTFYLFVTCLLFVRFLDYRCLSLNTASPHCTRQCLASISYLQKYPSSLCLPSGGVVIRSVTSVCVCVCMCLSACLSFCLSCWGSSFRKHWLRNVILGKRIHLQNI